MSNLIERLRAQGTFKSEITLYEEAADEIERLQEALERIAGALEYRSAIGPTGAAEIARNALKKIT